MCCCLYSTCVKDLYLFGISWTFFCFFILFAEQEEEQTLNNSWNCGGNSCATSPVNQSGLIKIMNQNGKWVMKCRNNGRSKRLFSCVLWGIFWWIYCRNRDSERNWFVVLGWCLMDLDADKNLTVRQIASLGLFHFAVPLVSL